MLQNINFGKKRYAYISWKDFYNKVPFTTKIIKKDFIINFQINKLLNNYFSNFMEIKDKVVIFEKSSYLIELSIFDGKMKYVGIKQYKGYRIMFNINGIDGYSVWKRKILLETFWSIKKSKEFIDNI